MESLEEFLKELDKGKYPSEDIERVMELILVIINEFKLGRLKDIYSFMTFYAAKVAIDHRNKHENE